MADTLESLEIEIKHGATGAASEIEAVADAVKHLRDSFNSSFVTRLENLAAALKSFNDVKNPINVNNFTGNNTFNKIVQSAQKTASATKNATEPLDEGMQKTIETAGRLRIAIHKSTEAAEKMGEAFANGDADAAWKAREQQLNAQAQANKIYDKMSQVPLAKNTQETIQEANNVEVLTQKLEALKIAQQEAFNVGDKNKAYSLQGQILNTTQALEKAKKALEPVKKNVVDINTVFKKLGDTFRKIGSEIKKVANTIKKQLADMVKHSNKTAGAIGKFVKSLGRIAFYRMIRGAIKAVTEAFKEGSENAYWFSREFGTATKYISEAYDSLTSASFKMKNQLGAAWASLIAAIAPVLMQIINMVTKAAEVVTQFFAILGGSNTYLKAIDYNKRWADSADKAGKAAKEWKNQLMGFDEINKLTDNDNSDSGNNNDIPDYGNMFEEVPVTKNFMSDLLDTLKNGQWAEAGKMLADKLNELVDSIDWHGLGAKIGEKINNVIQFAYNFLKNFDFLKFGRSLGEMLNGVLENIDFETAGRLLIRWFTAALDTLIGFITTPGLWKNVAKAIGDFLKGALDEAREWLAQQDFVYIAQTLSDGILGVLKRIQQEIHDHEDVFIRIGEAIGEMLGNIDWWGILTTVADIVWTVFKSVLEGLLSTNGGKIFLALVAAIKGLKLAFTLASPVVEAGAKILAENIAAKLLGIPAAATATATATGTAVKGIGTAMSAGAAVVAKGALAVVDAVLVAYDVKSLNDAAKTYKQAQDAHAKEAYTALNSYAKLYNEKGKEVADAWAKMVYDVDTTGDDFFGAQQTLTNKISELWKDTPQNMAQGFGQGIKQYFGSGGSGLVGLLNDAGNGIINAFKNVLGIHSPSTVFADMGKNVVEGFKNGIQNAWNSLASMVNQLLSNLVQTIGSKISSAVQSASQTISNMVSNARNTLSNITSSISSTVSSAINSAKNVVNTVKAKFFASGGYPEQGQLFVARENGPEMVGQIGGRTAVASNNDIREGIAEAVYSAFTSAISGNNGMDKDVNIYLDGKLIAKSTTKYQRQFAKAVG